MIFWSLFAIPYFISQYVQNLDSQEEFCLFLCLRLQKLECRGKELALVRRDYYVFSESREGNIFPLNQEEGTNYRELEILEVKWSFRDSKSSQLGRRTN